jgi:hypothetical protein
MALSTSFDVNFPSILIQSVVDIYRRFNGLVFVIWKCLGDLSVYACDIQIPFCNSGYFCF